MKINKFLKNIEDFFKSNKKEQDSLNEALLKLDDKMLKLFDKKNRNDFSEDDIENLQNKIKMVEELRAKIQKKIEKLNSRTSKE